MINVEHNLFDLQYGNTPKHTAVMHGYLAIFNMLLDTDADIGGISTVVSLAAHVLGFGLED